MRKLILGIAPRRGGIRSHRGDARLVRHGGEREALLLAAGHRARRRATSLQSDLIYHGGNAGPGAVGVLTKPYAYLIYWGTEWKQGFTTADTDGKLFTRATLQTT